MKSVLESGAQIKELLLEESKLLRAVRVSEAADLASQKSAALKSWQSAIAAHDQASFPREVLDVISEIVHIAIENSQRYLAIKSGIENVISRVTMSSSNAFVGAYSHTGSRILFSNSTGVYSKRV